MDRRGRSRSTPDNGAARPICGWCPGAGGLDGGAGRHPWRAGRAIGVTALAAGLAAWSAQRGRPAWVLAAGGCALAAAVVVAAHALLVEWHPLRAVAQRGAAATAAGAVRDDPRPIRTAGYGGAAREPSQVLSRPRWSGPQAGGGRWAVGGRVLLSRRPRSGPAAPRPGRHRRGPARPGRTQDLTVAVLRVRGPPRRSPRRRGGRTRPAGCAPGCARLRACCRRRRPACCPG